MTDDQIRKVIVCGEELLRVREDWARFRQRNSMSAENSEYWAPAENAAKVALIAAMKQAVGG